MRPVLGQPAFGAAAMEATSITLIPSRIPAIVFHPLLQRSEESFPSLSCEVVEKFVL